ncbi:hypothetical protein C8R48DRAFT_677599 [Suillus tomentosus]|nr:hypothetical protein C8R48DRAFT_677599 [Suillus tomentosus]
MSSPTVVDKTDTVTVCGDVVFFEVDGVLPNWKTYTFKASFDGPGTKTILFRLRGGVDPEVTTNLEISETTKVEKAEEDTSVKFEEEDTVIGGCEDVEIKQEDVELDGTSACIDGIIQCTALPCIHLPQITGNPDPNTRDIMLSEMRPWRHIVRPFSPSEIPERVEDMKQGRRRPIQWVFSG